MNSIKKDSFSFFCILLGFLLGYYLNNNINTEELDLKIKNNFIFLNLKFDLDWFFKILYKNIIVGLFLSIGGYFSAGILTVVILVANGYCLGIYFTYFKYSNVTFFEFTNFFIFHGIIEFFAFFLFARIGYNGIKFYKRIIRNDTFKTSLQLGDFYLPLILLITAATIETLLISNF